MSTTTGGDNTDGLCQGCLCYIYYKYNVTYQVATVIANLTGGFIVTKDLLKRFEDTIDLRNGSLGSTWIQFGKVDLFDLLIPLL